MEAYVSTLSYWVFQNRVKNLGRRKGEEIKCSLSQGKHVETIPLSFFLSLSPLPPPFLFENQHPQVPKERVVYS